MNDTVVLDDIECDDCKMIVLLSVSLHILS